MVEQKGDSSVHSESYGALWNLYRSANKLKLGNQILHQLDTDRNHYEVYLKLMRAYPKDWIERYSRYYMKETPKAYEQTYKEWKETIPMDIMHARLITDTLRSINFLYVAQKVPEGKLSERQKRLLTNLTKTGKVDIAKKKNLIRKDMGLGALTLIDSLDESIFKTSEIFFSVVLDLWKSLCLV